MLLRQNLWCSGTVMYSYINYLRVRLSLPLKHRELQKSIYCKYTQLDIVLYLTLLLILIMSNIKMAGNKIIQSSTTVQL